MTTWANSTDFIANLAIVSAAFYCGRFMTVLIQRKTSFIRESREEGTPSVLKSSSVHFFIIPIIGLLHLICSESYPGKKFDLKNSVTENAFAALAVVLFQNWGLTHPFFINLIFFFGLLSIFRIDQEAMIVPDSISIPWLGLGFASSLFDLNPNVNWIESLTGMCAGVAIFYIPGKIYERLNQSPGLGGGDVKLLAMIGSFTAVPGVLFTVLVAALSVLIVAFVSGSFNRSDRSTSFAFGPYLTSAAILYSLVWPSTAQVF